MPFSVELILSTSAQIQGPANATWSGAVESDFASTLWFPSSGPVFNLPGGFTLGSEAAGIVGDQLVPEPATALLLLAGVAALRRRAREGCA